MTADVDKVKISLAITNLVENAIKYNRDSGMVRVTLDADHKYFYIKVADTGIGIPEDVLERYYSSGFSGSDKGPAPGKWAATGLGHGYREKCHSDAPWYHRCGEYGGRGNHLQR